MPTNSAPRRQARGAVLLALLGSAAAAAQVGPGYDMQMSRMIPMRDGVELEAWITMPSKLPGKVPTILELTQYDIDGGRHGEPQYFARHGYAFVQAEVRGRGRSGGVKSDNLGPTVGHDGYDLVEWIARQPWSNAQVVMYGGSYVGMTQWRTATQHPPHLAAIAPYVPIYPGWDIPNTNGIPQSWTAVILGYTSGRTLNTGFIANQDYWAGKMLEQYAAQRPFTELDRAIGIAADQDWWMTDEHGTRVPVMTAWLDHVGDGDGFFKEQLLKPGQRVEIPFEFSWVAWRIAAGSRLRLTLMPLNSPNYQKNYNTGGRIGYEDPRQARVAHIRIFHDGQRSSRLVLPLTAAAR